LENPDKPGQVGTTKWWVRQHQVLGSALTSQQAAHFPMKSGRKQPSRIIILFNSLSLPPFGGGGEVPPKVGVGSPKGEGA